MEGKSLSEKNELKLNYSLKEALLLHKFDVILNVACLFVCIYQISTLAGNEEKSKFLIRFWLFFLLVSIFQLLFNLYYVFALTRNKKKYLYVVLFPLQLLYRVLLIGWIIYLIDCVVTVVQISEPYAVFAIFICSYCILDSIMVSILLISILVSAKPVANFLCKYWFIRDSFLLIFSYILLCFYMILLSSGNTSPVNIIFFFLGLIQAIIFSFYMKTKYFKPRTLEPKPLDTKVPGSKMLTDAFLLIAAMEGEKKEATGAA